MTYLTQRSSGYYFRLRIPSDLNSITKTTEIKRSLKTGSLCLAKERAFLLSGRLKKLFRRIRQTNMKLSKEHIDSLIKRYVKETLEAEEDERLMLGKIPEEVQKDMMEDFESFEENSKITLRTNCLESMESLVDNQILKPNNLNANKDSYEYKKLCRETAKACISVAQIQKRREQGDYSDDNISYFSGQQQLPEVATEETNKTSSGLSIAPLVHNWIKENMKADIWKPRTLKQYKGHFRVIFQIIDSKIFIDTIDHSTVRNIKDSLLKLPAGMNKKKIFQDKSVPEIISITEKESIETLSVNTINSYLITLGAFFKWCVHQGYMDKNYADGMKIKSSKTKRPDEQRKAFNTNHLKLMFESSFYCDDSFEKPYQFWLPLLGLYTGARINELCQLRLKDIQSIDGLLCLVLQEDPKDGTISLKNSASQRTIPLHPFIVQELKFEGFIDQLKSKGETRLFPELPYQNYSYGHVASKWFSTFKTNCGIESSQIVFHSFRHTLSDNLKQKLVSETLIDELTGHAIQGETMGRYGKRYTPKVLYNETILKLDYDINLEHLKGSKWSG